jgi:hypothetical protein
MSQLIIKAFVTSSLGVFCLTFVWALLTGVCIQILVLPSIPGLHAGNGLMAGGDWVWFHAEAVELASLMQYQGWQVWELRPKGNAPIGIAAGVYFFSGVSAPWILLPINAAIFSMAAASLHQIFKTIDSGLWAFVATLPFVLFPSATVIYSQIHKDVFSIAGIAIITLVWVRFAREREYDLRSLVGQAALIVVGCSLVWLVRPYLLSPLILASSITVALLISLFDSRRCVQWRAAILVCFFVQVVHLSIYKSVESEISTVEKTATVEETSFVEKGLARLNAKRLGFATTDQKAGSSIDVDVKFDSLTDLFLYVPRALQVGLLAPFPSMWFSDGVSPGSNLMRFITGVEVMISYVLLIGVGLLWFGLRGNRSAPTAAILMATVLILVLALVICNVGTLYRMRYGSWQLLNGLGVLGWGGVLRSRLLG